MPQTFSQNGHTLCLMWTFQSSWPFEEPCFLIVNEQKEQNSAQCPKSQNPNQRFEQKIIHGMMKTKKHPNLNLKIQSQC